MNIKVKGNQTLSGDIIPSGSKNSAVALLPASILFDTEVEYHNVPDITDVQKLVDILMKLGSKITWDKDNCTMKIDNSNISYEKLDKDEVKSMRGTSLLWGPMLARFGKVDFYDLPIGCTLGIRPLDPQYKALRDLGVKIEETTTSVNMDAGGAKAKEIWLDEMSPTATENVIMFAASLKGVTKVVGAASEPQVQNLCEFLIDAGAKIKGVGSSILEIKGGHKLRAKVHTIWSDHYEIATFLALAAANGGGIKVHNALPGKLVNIIRTFDKFGIKVDYQGSTAILKAGQKVKLRTRTETKTLIVRAQPWPALPVDLLPIFIPLALSAKGGQVLFHNWMYEAGLFWTSELTKLGANIIMADPHRVVVHGGNKLYGAKLSAPYIIRAVVSLVMSAMIAEGESLILNADALYRGHPKFVENLKKIGADIEEISQEN
jgi:UDP-N-acetylglucosamine 1-carboxyvinyltransferase